MPARYGHAGALSVQSGLTHRIDHREGNVMRMTRRALLGGMATAAAGGDRGLGLLRAASAEAGPTLRVGMVLPVTGPGADAGRFALDGAKLALERGQQGRRRSGQAARTRDRGRPDHQSRAPSWPSPSSRPSPTSSPSWVRSARPRTMPWRRISSRRGRPVCFGGTDPVLTHMGNPWLFRFRPERQLLGPRDRRFRHRNPRQEEVGRGPFDGCLRHQRCQGPE